MNALKSKPDYCTMYFHCQTILVENLLSAGNGTIAFDRHDQFAEESFNRKFAMARTYHRHKHGIDLF